MNNYDFSTLASTISNNPIPVVVYGAGIYGRITIHALNNTNIRVDAICDSDLRREGKDFCGFKIISPRTLGTFDRRTHIFLASIIIDPILEELSSLGFGNINNCIGLFENADYADLNLTDNSIEESTDQAESCDSLWVERYIDLYNKEHLCWKDSLLGSNYLRLKYIDIVITEDCSMKCIDCSNLMQYYVSPKHSDIELLFQSMDRLLTAIDHVFEFRVLGGEPFVNKQIHKIIDKIVSYNNVDKIVIFTNATIVPKGPNLFCLKNKKVILDITNYGELSRNYDKLVHALDSNSIRYISKRPTWTDSGRILPFQKRTEVELKHMFSNCCMNDVMTLLNGKLYRCPFSANGTNLGAIPYDKDDVIELSRTFNDHTLRKRVKSLYEGKDYLTACSYCSGRDYSTPKIIPAIQTKIPLTIPD